MRCLLLTCVLVCTYSLTGNLFGDVDIKLRDRSVHRQLVKRVVQVEKPAEDPAPAANPTNEPAAPATAGEPAEKAGSAQPPPPPPAPAAQKSASTQILSSLDDLKALLKANMDNVKESLLLEFIEAQEITEENLERVRLEELMGEWRSWYVENGAGRVCAGAAGLLFLTTLLFV